MGGRFPEPERQPPAPPASTATCTETPGLRGEAPAPGVAFESSSSPRPALPSVSLSKCRRNRE